MDVVRGEAFEYKNRLMDVTFAGVLRSVDHKSAV